MKADQYYKTLYMKAERQKFIEKYFNNIYLKDIPEGFCDRCGSQRCLRYIDEQINCYLKKIYKEKRLKVEV